MSIEEKRLAEQGISLPKIRMTGSGAVPYKLVGDLLVISAVAPLGDDGKLAYVGRIGSDLTEEEGYKAARLAGLNLLRLIKDALGSLDRVDFIVKSMVLVSAPAGFENLYKAADGFSDVLVEALGERGTHARNAVGASTLQGNAPILCDAFVKIRA